MKEFIEAKTSIIKSLFFIKLKFVFLAFLLYSQVHFSQSIEIPTLQNLKNYSDFRKIEPKVLNIINWLNSSKHFDTKETREKAISFVDEFVKKNGYVDYNYNASFVDLEQNSEYALQYKLGWLKFVLEYEYSKNLLQNHLKASEYLIAFYDTNKSKFGKNSYVEKIKKLKQQNKLKTYIKSEI